MVEFDGLLRLIEALNRQEVEYIVVGGIALGLHGLTRATQDVDIFVRPSEENIDRLRAALRSIWNDPDIEQITAEDLGGEYAAVRYGPPGEEWTIDFLSGLGTAFRYDDLAWHVVEAGGLSTRVATPQTLYEMKKGTIRPQDKVDAAALRERFSLEP
jgi:hypothetical protein